MKSLKLSAAIIALVFAGAASAAHSGEQLVLEEVVVTAKAPPRPEFVIVVAEMPAELRAAKTADVGETFEVVLAVEPPQVEAAAPGEIRAPRPMLIL